MALTLSCIKLSIRITLMPIRSAKAISEHLQHIYFGSENFTCFYDKQCFGLEQRNQSWTVTHRSCV